MRYAATDRRHFLQVDRASLIFFLCQGVHLVLYGLLLERGLQPGVLTASGMVCTVTYTWFFLRQIRRAGESVPPIAFYLAASIFRLGIGTFYVVSLVRNGLRWDLMVGQHDVYPFLMYGHWIAMLGDFAFLAGYMALASRGAPGQQTLEVWDRAAGKRVFGLAAVFYLGCLLVKFVSYSVSFGGFGQLVNYVENFGPSAAVLVMLSQMRSPQLRLRPPLTWFAWAALVVNIVWSFFSYMKSDLLIALLPLILLWFSDAWAWLRARQLGTLLTRAVLVVFILYFFLFVVSAYSQLRRAEFWASPLQRGPASELQVPVMTHLREAVAASVPQSGAFQRIHRYPDKGVWGMVARMSLMPYSAWAYGRVTTVGENPDSFFKALLVAVTPRLLWPEKPSLSPGADFSAIIGMASSGATARSATALTLQGAYFWWGGYPALLAGCFATGAGFALVWRMFRRQRFVNPAAALMTLVLCYNGFHWFESGFLGGFPMYLYATIVFLPLQMLLRYVLVGRPRGEMPLPLAAR